MFNNAQRHHGLFLSQLVSLSPQGVRIREFRLKQSRIYIVNNKVPVFVKYASSETSPWTFTFTRDQQEAQQQLREMSGFCITAFVCGMDGIAALRHHDFRQVLDDEFEEVENVTIRREHGRSYDIRGRDGQLEMPVPRNSLAKALNSAFAELKPRQLTSAA